MAVCFVYITAESRDQAIAIGRTLVDERLAACANVSGPITSIFRWDEAVQEGEEHVLIAKTRDSLVDRLTARVEALHSYDCPCVVALPIDGGHRPFLDWIVTETSAEEA